MRMLQPAFASLLACAALFSMGTVQADESGDTVLGPDGKLTVPKTTVSTNKKPIAEAITSGTDTVRTAGTILFVIGMATATALWFRHMRKEKLRKGPAAASLEVVGRLSLGPRREIILVRAGDQVLVLGSANNDLKLLTALPQAPAADDDLDPATFDKFYRKYTGEKSAKQAAPAVEPAFSRADVEVDWPRVSVGGRP